MTTAFACGGGQAAAVAPFWARHASTRQRPVPAKQLRRASRSKPCPSPPAPAWRQALVVPGQQNNFKTIACRVSACHVGQPWRRLGGDKPCPTRSELRGRAGRGAGGAEGISAMARTSPCARAPRPERRHGRGLAALRTRPRQAVAAPQPDRPTARSNARFRAGPERQQRAVAGHPIVCWLTPGRQTNGLNPLPVVARTTVPRHAAGHTGGDKFAPLRPSHGPGAAA